MNIYELESTTENIMQTFVDDKINRYLELKSIISKLVSINGSCSIALEGAWGSGKTFFIKQLELILLSYSITLNNKINTFNVTETLKSKFIEKKDSIFDIKLTGINFIPIYYDAWLNDNDDDPILSLIYTIVNTLNCTEEISTLEINCKGIISSIVSKIAPIDFNNITEKNPLDRINNQKLLQENITEFLSKIKIERGDRIVIFIDELDRCQPSFAVKLLERIKHYFSNKDIIFIFSVNILELQHTVCQIYGNKFNGSRYLDRFFDVRIPLLKSNFSNLIADEDKDDNITIDFSSQKKIIKFITDALDIQLRESCKLQSYIDIMNNDDMIDSYKTNKIHSSVFSFLTILVLPIAYAYNLIDKTDYNEFINGNKFELISKLIEETDYLDSLFIRMMDFNPSDKIDKGVESDEFEQLYKSLCTTKQTNQLYHYRREKITVDENSIKIFNEKLSLLL